MADFDQRLDAFQQRGALVIGGSVDTLEDAGKTVNRYKLRLPVAYGLDARAVSAATGAFYDEAEGFLHATGFILKRDGTVALALYSTGAFGRLTPDDCLRWIDYLVQKGRA